MDSSRYSYLRTCLCVTAASLCFTALVPMELHAAGEDVQEILVTATLTETKGHEVGTSYTVITAAQMEQKRLHTVAQALREVPGVDVVRSGGPGGNTSVFIRGGNSEHTLVLIDGVEVNDPSSPSRAFNFADLTVDNVERIEVIRGAQSTLYGSDALAGVINIITKKATEKPRMSVSSEAGSYQSFTQNVSAGGAFERGDVSLSASRQDIGGISAAQAGSEDDEYENTSVSGRAAAQFSEHVQFEMTGRFHDAKVDLDNLVGLPTDDIDRVLSSRFTALQATTTIDAFDGLLDQDLTVGYSNTDREDNSDPDLPNTEQLRSSFEGSLLTLRSRNTAKIADDHRLTFGVEWQKERASSAYVSQSQFGLITADFDPQKTRNTGYFLQGQFGFVDTFYTTTGIRVDDHSAFGTEVTWRAAQSAVLQETGTELRASVGTGYKAPSLVQRLSAFGNPDLSPEESLTVDAGVMQQFFDDAAEAGVTYFWNRFDELITYDTETFTLQNISEATTQGLEIYAAADAAPGLRVRADYTYTLTEDESSGEDLLRRPENKISVSANYEVCESLSGTVAVHYVGAREDTDFSSNPASRIELDSYSLVNAAVNYRHSERTSFFLRLHNILDEEYEEVLGFGTLGAAAYGGVELRL